MEGQIKQHNTRITNLGSRVKVVERRVNNVEQKLQSEIERSVNVDTDLKELVVTLNDTLVRVADKNHITEFFKSHWKYIALWVTITLGGDVQTLVQYLGPLLGQ